MTNPDPKPEEAWGLYDASGELMTDRDGRLSLFISESAADKAQLREDIQHRVPSGYPPVTRGWSIRHGVFTPMAEEGK